MTREEMRIALSREEMDYPALAAELDASDIPLLREFASSDDPMFATKAVYLASLLRADAAVDIVEQAARSRRELVRIAAASALPNIANDRRNAIALRLIDDSSIEIKKLILVAVERPTPELEGRIRSIFNTTPVERLRDLAEERLRPQR